MDCASGKENKQTELVRSQFAAIGWSEFHLHFIKVFSNYPFLDGTEIPI